MFLTEPQRTDYDLNFHCFGFPVRVHPLFWLAGLILGAGGAWDDQGNIMPDAGTNLLSWVGVLFVSILVHELGHALMMRRFGHSAHIVLYLLGGLAVPDSATSFSYSQPARRTPTSNILISLAGPGAGFLLAGLTVALIYALGGEFRILPNHFPFFTFIESEQMSGPLETVIWHLLYINIFWGLVNLLPVFPLDGGQVARALYERADPWNGFARSLWLSIITGVVVAIASWVYIDSRFMPLMFGSLAISNYLTLQQISGGGFGGRPW